MSIPRQPASRAGFRHEIRNNLTLLSGRLQLLAARYPFLSEDDLFLQLQEDLSAIYKLLNDDKYHERPQLLPCDLKPVLEALYQSCLPVFRQQGLLLSLQLPETLPVIRADAQLIRQALLNLLKNAAEASSKGQHICLAAEVSDSQLRLIVSDTGTGMTPQQQRHIFDPFVSYKDGGTGLGLAIVKSTVYAHHGQISCQSEPGAGTIFTIALPIAAVPDVFAVSDTEEAPEPHQ